MKIKPEHLEQLRQAIDAACGTILPGYAAKIREEYAAKFKPEDKRDAEKRIRWDALWCAQRTKALPEKFFDEVYKYANDEHLDTALKKVVGPLLAA
jgi:hypothetical protein